MRKEFCWHDKKNSINTQKHGISFNTAITAFDDPFALLYEDEKHSSSSEQRKILVGDCDLNVVIVVIFTEKTKEGMIRLISARRANRKERIKYEEIKKIPF